MVKTKIMQVKKYLIEQLNMKDQDKLNRAVALNCFGANMIVEPTPKFKTLNIGTVTLDKWVLDAKGKQSKKDYLILANPMEIIDVTEAAKPADQRTGRVQIPWTCTNLEVNSEQKTYLKQLEQKGWTTTYPTEKDVDDGVWLAFDLVTNKKYDPATKEWSAATKSDVPYADVMAYSPYFENLLIGNNGSILIFKRNPVKKTFVAEDPKVCRNSIKELVILKRKKKVEDDAYIENLRRTVQNCVNQRDFVLRPDIRKDIEELTNIMPSGPDAKFRITMPQRESLSRLVGRVLREEKEKKTNKIIETKIIESRLKFILEDTKQMAKLTKPQRIKKSFNFLTELNQVEKLGLVNENLTDTFKQIFGKSLDSMVGNVSEPLLNSVFIKVSLPDDVKNQVLNKIKEKTQELIKNMDTCDNLAKFLSTEVSEVLAENMKNKNIFNSELVNSAMADALTDESFKQRLAEKMKSQVCELFDKFSSNAQNLVTKLTSSEV